MKRNILLAGLVALAGTVVALGGAPAAAIDVECRFAPPPAPGQDPVPIPPIPPVPPGPQPNQVIYVSGVTSALPYRAVYSTQQPSWSVVAVRPPVGTDYNLTVRDCDFGRRALSVLPDAAVDFVALDGNQPVPSRFSATVSNATERVGTFALEYSTGGPALVPYSSQTLMLRGTPAVVRDVYVPAGGTAIVSLRPLSGDADLAVVASTSDSWMVARAQSVQTSTQPGLSEDRVVITVPVGTPGRTFGVVVINNALVTEAVLSRY